MSWNVLPRALVRLAAVAFLLALLPPVWAADDKAAPGETWDVILLGKDKVGYVHSTVSNVTEAGRNLIAVQIETVMSMKRFGQTIDMKLNYTSVETPEGKLLRVDNQGPAKNQRTRGEVAGKEMKLTMETLGKTTTATIPWSDDVLGPAAEERILREEGLKPGQKRSFRTFSPDLNRIVTTALYGEDMEEVSLFDGSKQTLQRIREVIEDIPELRNLKVHAWVDEKGDTLKTHMDMLGGMTTYRVSKEVALAKPGTISGDFGFSTLIKANKKIPEAYNTTEVVYRIALEDEDPFKVFPQDERQKLSRGDNGDVLLTIRTIDPSESNGKVNDLANEFHEPNNMLQSDDPKVVAAAKEAVGDATDPWEKAKRLEKWVFQHISEKNFSAVFDSAADVAEKLEGDCTEHGVLLAAMARAAGIPSRVAAGLVYADRIGVFGYHMWAELYVNGRWVPLDATLGLGHASPAHIKIVQSSLAGVDGSTTVMLPILQVMDKIKIEVVSWKGRQEKQD